jgi:starch synthase (maltosyl-transferring)
MTKHGLQRVIVEHVTPEIDAGRFYIIKVPGDIVRVEADIFTDGHDHVGGRVLYKHEDEKKWVHVPMHLMYNDRWQASFELTKTGFYYYTVTGWVDHPLTWLEGFFKKYQDAQHMGVELLIGADFLEAMLPQASKADQNCLIKLSQPCVTRANMMRRSTWLWVRMCIILSRPTRTLTMRQLT